MMPEKPCKKYQLSPETKKRLLGILREMQEEKPDPECLRLLPKVSFPQLRSSEVRAHG